MCYFTMPVNINEVPTLCRAKYEAIQSVLEHGNNTLLFLIPWNVPFILAKVINNFS